MAQPQAYGGCARCGSPISVQRPFEPLDVVFVLEVIVISFEVELLLLAC